MRLRKRTGLLRGEEDEDEDCSKDSWSNDKRLTCECSDDWTKKRKLYNRHDRSRCTIILSVLYLKGV